MKLSVIERILLGNMLSAKEGNFVTLKLVRQAREGLSFTDEEIEKLKFAQDGNSLQWNVDAAVELNEVEIELSPTAISIVKATLDKLNDEAKLTEQHFSLYEKFIEDYKPKLVS